MSERLQRFLPLALALIALAVVIYASVATSLAVDELSVLAEVNRNAVLVKRVAQQGFSQLFAPDAGAGNLRSLLSAWARLSLGRSIDPLTSVRIPGLLLSAGAALAVYGITAPARGRVVGVLAAFGLLFLPRWLHASVLQSEGAIVASLWMIVLCTYVRSQTRNRSRFVWAFAGGAVLGFGTALSFATLWVLLFVILHFAVTRARATRRMATQGRIPVPLLVITSGIVGPVLFFIASPTLWKAASPAIVRHVLSPLGPSIAATRYFGRDVTLLPVPGGFTLRWLLETTPLVMLILGVGGVFVSVHRLLARRFASGALRPPRDRTGLDVIVLLGLCVTVLGGWLAPDALTTFPPRVELALPFVAIAAALGLERMFDWVRPVRLRLVPAIAVIALLAVSTLSGLRTSSASFNFLFGGVRGALDRQSFRIHDGSELGPLLRELEKRGGVHLPPGVPPALFSELAALRRTRELGPGNANLVYLPKKTPAGAPVIRRDGVVIWAVE
jgi:hypothetical protein